MDVRFEITEDCRIFVVIDNNGLARQQVSYLATRPTPGEWEKLQSVLAHTFMAGLKTRSRQIAKLLME